MTAIFFLMVLFTSIHLILIFTISIVLSLILFFSNSRSWIYTISYLLIICLFIFIEVNGYALIRNIIQQQPTAVILSALSVTIGYLAWISSVKVGEMQRDSYLNSIITEISIKSTEPEVQQNISVEKILTEINPIYRYIPILKIGAKSKIKIKMDRNIDEFILWRIYNDYSKYLQKPIEKDVEGEKYIYTLKLSTVRRDSIQEYLVAIMKESIKRQIIYEDPRHEFESKIRLGIRTTRPKNITSKFTQIRQLYNLRKAYNKDEFILYVDTTRNLYSGEEYFIRDYFRQAYTLSDYEYIRNILDVRSKIEGVAVGDDRNFIDNISNSDGDFNEYFTFYMRKVEVSHFDNTNEEEKFNWKINSKYHQKCLNKLNIDYDVLDNLDSTNIIDGFYSVPLKINTSQTNIRDPILYSDSIDKARDESLSIYMITTSQKNIFLHYRSDKHHIVLSPLKEGLDKPKIEDMLDCFGIVAHTHISDDHSVESPGFGYPLYKVKNNKKTKICSEFEDKIEISRGLKFN